MTKGKNEFEYFLKIYLKINRTILVCIQIPDKLMPNFFFLIIMIYNKHKHI
jgi:hypothetical protein